MHTKTTSNFPMTGVNLTPNKSLTWDVNTITAAPVVNPDTNDSDRSMDIVPNRQTYIIS